MTKRCAACGEPFVAKRAAAKFCGDTCRQRAKRAGGAAASEPVDSGTFAATRAALDAVNRADTVMGALALALAAKIDATPGAGAAPLAKELRVTLDRALEGVAAADAMDELKARRDHKLAAAG